MKLVAAKSSAEGCASEGIGLPEWVKTATKAIVSIPFTFHSFNGLRHLMWDMGYGELLSWLYAGSFRIDSGEGYFYRLPQD